jgi:hypothetical protein
VNNNDFINMIKALYFIDRNMLRELSKDDWNAFRIDPARYLIVASKSQQAAIMREIRKHV